MRFAEPGSAARMLAIPIAVLLLFTFIPTLAGVLLSVFEWNGGPLADARFVGFANYRRLFTADPQFLPALRNTLILTVASVAVTTLAAFALAVILNARWFKGRSIVSTIIFVPTVVSIVACGFVWRWLLDRDGGLVNHAARLLGISDPPDWLAPGPLALAAVILVTIWRALGFCLVIYLAALASADPSLTEAAQIDGASRTRIVRSVLWPQLHRTTTFLLITGAIAALQTFDAVFVLTAQQETRHTQVLNLLLYREFTQGRLGYAAAVGVVIIALALLALAILRTPPSARAA